jgi:hypothetical protein
MFYRLFSAPLAWYSWRQLGVWNLTYAKEALGMKCEHYACRCERARELCEMADRRERAGGSGSGLIFEAAHLEVVECREFPPAAPALSRAPF